MPQAALDQAIVLSQITAFVNFYNNYKRGAAPTHWRKAVLDLLMAATEDARLTNPYDPLVSYTKVDYRAIDRAVAHIDENMRLYGEEWKTAGSGAVRNRKALALIQATDIMLGNLLHENFANIFGMAKATYSPRFVDVDSDLIDDTLQSVVPLVAPPAIANAAPAAGNTLTLLRSTAADFRNAASVALQWHKNGSASGQPTTATKVTATPADANSEYSCRVTVTGNNGQIAVFWTPPVFVSPAA
jgi:hypothetical protein